MHSHIALKLNGKETAMSHDASISIVDENPIFNNTELYTLPFQLPFDGNRQTLEIIDQRDAEKHPHEIDGARANLIVDGLPFRSGYVVTEKGSELSGHLAINIDSRKRSLQDLIGDLRCRDVPVKDRIPIGEKIGNVHVEISYYQTFRLHGEWGGKKDGGSVTITGSINDLQDLSSDFEPQALGFSYPGKCVTNTQKTGYLAVEKEKKSYHKVTTYNYKGEEYQSGGDIPVPQLTDDGDYINVHKPYPFPYCNARVAYAHMVLDKDGKTIRLASVKEATQYIRDKNTSEMESKYPYWVLDARRPQSGICFYVLYFLDCLFNHLGVTFDNKALLQIEDLKNLCFFTTHCKYDTERAYPGSAPDFTTYDQINNWLSSRGCGGRLVFEDPQTQELDSIDLQRPDGMHHYEKDEHIQEIQLTNHVRWQTVSANVLTMLANSENFPDTDVMSIINSLESSFGIRFSYDSEMNKVTAYLLRDVYRDNTPPIDFLGEVLSFTVINEKNTGFRMRYSAESDKKEQLDNVKHDVPDYNTSFDYIDYNSRNVVIGLSYREISQQITSRNMNCYIDMATGNAYRVKIDSEYAEGGAANPRLFEVGQNKGIELGNCSPENEDNIIDYTSDFTPVPFGDVNSIGNKVNNLVKAPSTYQASNGESGTILGVNTGLEPMMCVILSEEMEPAFVEHRIQNVIPGQVVDFYVSETLNLVESYDPSKTEDGNSPLQEIDWGTSIAVMRGGGTDATLEQYDYNYDGFGNAKWRMKPGVYALSSDSLDILGNEFDYNGTASGSGGGERFSLKIAAYKPFRFKGSGSSLQISTNPEDWENDPSWLIPCAADQYYNGHLETKIRSRGLFDTFMAEHARFLMHRKKYRVKALCTAAQLIDVKNHWRHRYNIDGRIGWINKMEYDINAQTGIGEVTIEFLS